MQIIMERSKMFLLMLSSLAVILNVSVTAVDIGVNYGLLGDNLPDPNDVVKLYKRYNIPKLRLFDPNPDVLNALRGSQLEVIVGVKNQDLPALAASDDAINGWFAANIEPYLNDVNFTYIAVGNEIVPGDLGQHVLPVIASFQNLVSNRNLPIKISYAADMTVLGQSYPPSAGSFTPEARKQLVPILKYLSETGTPILANIYSLYGYTTDPKNIRLDYAILNTTDIVVRDGDLGYWNMFDAIFDAFVWAMEKEGVTNLPVVVSETGWPSEGNGDYTTKEIAATHTRNLVKHCTSNVGTPKRPNIRIEAFIFAIFNENQKKAGTEQHFGLFYPDMTPVYDVFN